MAGKGDKDRTSDHKKYRENWETIFKKIDKDSILKKDLKDDKDEISNTN